MATSLVNCCRGRFFLADKPTLLMAMAQSNQITTIDYTPEYYISLTDGVQLRVVYS